MDNRVATGSTKGPEDRSSGPFVSASSAAQSSPAIVWYGVFLLSAPNL